ncbi:MAG: radical SAM protein [Candidatus Omnitrophota bacterium]
MNDRIVLINPPPEKLVEEYDAPPYGHIGLAYLGAALRGRGFNCSILDAKLGRMSRGEVAGKVSDINPAIVGITSHTHEIKTAASLAQDIKRRVPGVKIVIGGIHASCLPLDTLRDFDCYDFLIKGEGEDALIGLSDAVMNNREGAISAIPGLTYRRGHDVVSVPQGGWITDLDRLPFPAWDLFPEIGIFPVMSSRGCPYKCIFCARMLGDSVRTRSPGNVISELKFLTEKFGAKKIYFYDETFGFYRKWLTEFLDLMISSGLGRRLTWGITTRAQLIDTEILKSLKEAGCRKVDFGVESGDERILKIIRKGETKEDFLRAASLVKKAGIESHAYFILGHPHETRESAMNTIDFAARLNTDHISLGIMVPYPGTEVARLAQNGEGGYKKMSFNWADYNKQLANALELESISRAELTRLQLLGYLKFYVLNLKIAPFLAALFKYRKLILAIMAKYLKASAGERTKGAA